MKTFTIRLPDVEAAMLVELQRTDKKMRDLNIFCSGYIRKRFGEINAAREAKRGSI